MKSRLIPNKKQKTLKKESIDFFFAKKLYKALSKHRRVYRKLDINKWALSFRKLRVEDEVNKKDISVILSWYIQHIGQSGIPEAFSASSFREKFDQIANSMHRVEGSDFVDDFPVKITIKGNERITEIDYGD